MNNFPNQVSPDINFFNSIKSLKKNPNQNIAITIQLEEPSSFSYLDNMKEDTLETNDDSTAAGIDEDDEDIFVRGKSSTISKYQDIDTRPSHGSINLQKRAFKPRMSIQVPIAIKAESSLLKQEINFLSKYQLGRKLGEGVNGIVKICYVKEEGETSIKLSEPYAVKIIKTESIIETLEIQRESQILQQLNHPSIIQFKDLIFEKNIGKAYLVQEYARGKSLTSYLNEDCLNRRLNEKQAVVIIKQILQGLSSLHHKNFCHFDLKTDNIIYNEADGKIKIIDFSSSRKQCPNQKLLTNIGTLNYKSPEYFDGSQRNSKTDIWSTGVILYQLLTGNLPFDDFSGNSKSIIENIKNRKFQQDYKSIMSPKMVEILECMLALDQHQRHSANQILSKLSKSVELFPIEQMSKQKKQSNNVSAINNFLSSMRKEDVQINRILKKQTSIEKGISPKLKHSNTLRYLNLETQNKIDFKNIVSTIFDHELA